MRIAAIDIGTNSIHLMVADIDADGSIQLVESTREQAELGTGGLDAELLVPDAFARGVETLVRFRETCDSFDVEHIACAATSAVREAANGALFCATVKERTGIHVRVIAGVEEARMIWLGARPDLDFSRGRILLFDVGGGSTELILCDAESILVSESLRLGHIRLAEGYHHCEPMSDAEQDKMRKAIAKRLKVFRRRVHPDDLSGVVGTSGTVRALARMEATANGFDYPEHQHGMVLSKAGLDRLVEQLCSTNEEERGALPGLDSRRVRTLPSGAILVQEVMQAFNKTHIVTSNRSLRDGLLVDWIIKHKPELDLSRQLADPRRRSVRAMMDRYGVKKQHADFVVRACHTLFDATAHLHRLRIDDRRLLTFAAQLHDVGHHISGRRHDKRGAYLIRHTHLPGFTAPEIAIIERIVRYHRDGQPRKNHSRFAALSRADRRRVTVLSGILAVADAFDRGHHQNVIELSAVLDKKTLSIEAVTERAPDLERWASLRRARRLSKSLGIQIHIEIHQQDRAETDEEPQAPPSPLSG